MKIANTAGTIVPLDHNARGTSSCTPYSVLEYHLMSIRRDLDILNLVPTAVTTSCDDSMPAQNALLTAHAHESPAGMLRGV